MAHTSRAVQRSAPRARAAPKRVDFRLRPGLAIACLVACLGIAVAGRTLHQSSMDRSSSGKPFAGLAQRLSVLSAPSPAVVPAAAAAAVTLPTTTSITIESTATSALPQSEPSALASAAQQVVSQEQAAASDVSANMNMQSTTPAYTYDAIDPSSTASQPAVAYDSSGRAFLVMPVDAAAAQQAQATATPMQTPSNDPSATAITPSTTPSTVMPQVDGVTSSTQVGAVQTAAGVTTDPRVQAASGPMGGWLEDKFKRLHEDAPAEPPQVVVVPAPQTAAVPQQVAAAAAPALSTPTVIGGPVRIVTSNPISISTPVKTVNPTFTKTFGGGGSVLASAAGLLGSLFPANAGR